METRRIDVDKLPWSKITPSNKIVPLILRQWKCLKGFLPFFKGVADFNLQSHEMKVYLRLILLEIYFYLIYLLFSCQSSAAQVFYGKMGVKDL